MRNRSSFLALLLICGGAVARAQNPPALVNPVGQDGAVPAGAAQAKPPAGGGPLSEKSSVDEVLGALDARGRNLREFVADVSLKEIDEATQLDSIRTGRVTYQKQKDDDRIRVVFNQ